MERWQQSPPSPPPPSPPSRIILGKYQLTKFLGRGNFAKVYQARSLIDGSTVAVKVIDKSKTVDASMEPRIVREIDAMRRLQNHPNILKIHEVLATKTKIYLIVDFAGGGELFLKLSRRGQEFYELSSPRVNTRNTHGTGCTMASCIAAELAKGSSMLSAVKIAKRFVEAALEYSRDLVIGNGVQGPFDHFLALKNINQSSYRQDRFNPNDLFLYAVTDSGMNRKWGRSIAEAVKAAVEGGATIVQLREKDAETKDFVDAAKVCLKICRSYGVPLLINDRIDVALACDADGVHVGQSDMPARLARTILGPEKIIGVSCKTPEHAHQAWVDGADYIGSGGVYPTNTKENNRTIGLDGLKEVCKASKLPVVAIGGIGMSNARAVMELGVPSLKGVAVVSALFDRECILTETRNLHAVISEAALLTQ